MKRSRRTCTPMPRIAGALQQLVAAGCAVDDLRVPRAIASGKMGKGALDQPESRQDGAVKRQGCRTFASSRSDCSGVAMLRRLVAVGQVTIWMTTLVRWPRNDRIPALPATTVSLLPMPNTATPLLRRCRLGHRRLRRARSARPKYLPGNVRHAEHFPECRRRIQVLRPARFDSAPPWVPPLAYRPSRGTT